MFNLLIATIRRNRRIIARRFAVIDVTFLTEEEVIYHAEHELRSNIDFAYCRIDFDFIPVMEVLPT